MALFECSKCSVIENTATALGGYYRQVSVGKPPLCSQCFLGTWHNKFERKFVHETDYITIEDSYLLKDT